MIKPQTPKATPIGNKLGIDVNRPNLIDLKESTIVKSMRRAPIVKAKVS